MVSNDDIAHKPTATTTYQLYYTHCCWHIYQPHPSEPPHWGNHSDTDEIPKTSTYV